MKNRPLYLASYPELGVLGLASALRRKIACLSVAPVEKFV
jgi:hypothetical protein